MCDQENVPTLVKVEPGVGQVADGDFRDPHLPQHIVEPNTDLPQTQENDTTDEPPHQL